MTAPFDARYLVPLSALPFRPHGATLAWECKTCGWVFAPHTGSTLSCEHADGPDVVDCIDLSAPPGDPPARLDALGWALAVLGRRFGVKLDDIDDLRPMVWRGSTSWELHPFAGRYTPVLVHGDPGWEEYDPTDPNQPRRIVAAVLRNHVQKEPTP